MPVTGAATYDAASGNITFNISTASTYTYTIIGFGTGDSIVYPALTSVSVNNTSGTDGIVDVVGAASGQVVTVRLTGLAPAVDGAIFNATSFKAQFGATSLQP